MDVRKALLFIAGQEYTNYADMRIQPGGLRKLGAAEVLLKNAARNFGLTIPATLTDFVNGFELTPNGPVKPVITPEGKGLEFNGVNTWLEMPDHDDFVFFDVSVETWVKFPNENTDTGYIAEFHKASSGFILYIAATGDTACFFVEGEGSADTVYCVGTSDISDGEYHHVVGVRDISAGKVRIYVDGAMEKEEDDISDGEINPSTEPFYVGMSRNSTFYVDGEIASVRIYKKALTQGDIDQALLRNPTREDLFAEWTFEDIVTHPRPDFETQLGETVIQFEDGVLVMPSSLLDSMGDNDLSLTGNPTPVLTPQGKGVKVSQNNYVKCPSSDSLNIIDEISLEMWVRHRTGLADEAMQWFGGISKQDCFDVGWQGWTDGWTIDLYNQTVRKSLDSYNVPVVAGQWYHVVGVYDPPNLLLYVDGELVTSGDIGSVTIDVTTDEFRIGMCQSMQWDGEFDAVRIYNRALQLADVQQAYNGHPSREGLVSEWTFNDIRGTRKNVFRGYPVEMEEEWPDIRLSLEDFASFLKWRIIKYDHIYRQVRLGDIFKDILEKYAPEISPGEIDPLLPWVRFCKVKEGYKVFDAFGELGRKFNVGFHVDADKVFHAFNLSPVGSPSYTIEEGENVEVSNLRREFDKILSKAIMTCTLNNPKFRDEWTNDVDVDEWASSPQLLATLYPTDDCYADAGDPTNPHDALNLRVSQSPDRNTYVKFSLGSYDDFGKGTKIRLYCYQWSGAPPYLNIYEINSDAWDESTITWNSKPALGDIMAENFPSGTGWREYDIQSWAQACKDAARSYMSFALSVGFSGDSNDFRDKEYDSYDPEFLVYGFDTGGVFKNRINSAYRSYCITVGKSLFRAQYPQSHDLALDISIYKKFTVKMKAESAMTVRVKLCKDASKYYYGDCSVTTTYQAFDFSIKGDMTETGTAGETIQYIQFEKPDTPIVALMIDLMYAYGPESKVEVEIGEATFSFWSDRADFLNKGFVGTLDDAKTLLNEYIQARHQAILSPRVSLPVRKLGGDALDAIHPGTVVTLVIGSSGFSENMFCLEPQWFVTPDAIRFSAQLSNVIGGLAEYLYNPTTNTINVEEIELACETQCEIGCELTCETGCETGCEIACQIGSCEIDCQTGCETACQSDCELACQTTCQQNCQTECELACLGDCRTVCQTACEQGCQTSCEISCQSGCRIECELACLVTCKTSCELGCETECETGCQTYCEFHCQASCEIICESGCLFGCETTCEVTCQTSCEAECRTSCESSCQSTCEIACQVGCESGCLTSCEVTCRDACESTCQTQCEISCQTSCELACQTACEDTCQSTCMNACQSLCLQGCLESCEVACQSGCELNCQETCELSCQATCEVNCMTCAQNPWY